MDPTRFDGLVKALSTRTSRGGAVRLLGGATAVLATTVVGRRSTAAESESVMEANADAMAGKCRDQGGTPEVHYEFWPDGTLATIHITCDNPEGRGWACLYNNWDCTNPLRRPDESPRADGGGGVYAPAEDGEGGGGGYVPHDGEPDPGRLDPRRARR